jgi:hypothetical protein
MLRRIAFATFLSALVLAEPASADPGNGAQHSKSSGCITEPGLFTLCFEQHIVTNTTENQNNVSMFVHSRSRSTFTGDPFIGEPGGPDPGCTITDTNTVKNHRLIKADSGVHEFHFKLRSLDVFVDCPPLPSQRCTGLTSFHFANGQVQYSRSEGSCDPL